MKPHFCLARLKRMLYATTPEPVVRQAVDRFYQEALLLMMRTDA